MPAWWCLRNMGRAASRDLGEGPRGHVDSDVGGLWLLMDYNLDIIMDIKAARGIIILLVRGLTGLSCSLS